MDKINELVQTLENYNEAYRLGQPEVSDEKYDLLVESLRELDPTHTFFAKVEPETFDGKVEVRHPRPMLSTEKAYHDEDLERFITRINKAATEIGLSTVEYVVMAKLDGLAGRDDGQVFASRGNGQVGYEISSAFDKGVVPVGGRGKGLGEIVMVKSYFEEHLGGVFEHPRNMVVGIVTSDTLNENAKQALTDGVVRFVPYSELPKWRGSGRELIDNLESIKHHLIGDIDYPVDGLVAEVTDGRLKEHMGATQHHYRWQIAIKTIGESGETLVQDILWQVGRTGNVTPVMLVTPIKLSGATIKRVTAHHAGMIVKQKIGKNAKIEIIRSGEVIPKLVAVLGQSDDVIVPDACPVCDTNLSWQNDFLKCTNPNCPAQIEQKIVHWFKILGNADWFGIKTVKKLVDQGYDSLEKIYAMAEEDFVALGFGPVQSKNLFDALGISKNKSVEDWRFLAAFGISDLGKGDSRKLLAHKPIDQLSELTADDIKAIHGFGDITSESISQGLLNIKDTMDHMLALNFNLTKTPLENETKTIESPIAGKGVVFTGKMLRGSREDMQAMARKLGATVQTSVTGKTDFLVCGENVGAKKIEKAEEKGTRILNEDEFYEMVEGI